MKDLIKIAKTIAVSTGTLLVSFLAPAFVFELILGADNFAYRWFLILAGISSVVVTGITTVKFTKKW